MSNQKRRHPRFVHPDAEPIASDSRLGDFEEGAPDPILIADTNLTIGQPLHRELLAELAEGEVCTMMSFSPQYR